MDSRHPLIYLKVSHSPFIIEIHVKDYWWGKYELVNRDIGASRPVITELLAAQTSAES